jgi:Rps23 Pro-64 3,4-dihydroxylase Tpa1-like proline 4-hydroxylase
MPTTQEHVGRFVFRRAALLSVADRLHDGYAGAAPFPHVVIDDFLPSDVLEEAVAEFPEPKDTDWEQFDNRHEIKLALADVELIGTATRNLLNEFNGQVFVEFLERLTGITGLVADHHLEGGGLHQIRAGGFLKVHADFNRHERLRLDRRINVLVYLNQNWRDEWGGDLQLWSRDMSECEHRILPVFNRMVIFSTTDDANHGHPDPLRCPADRARRSLALYYYTNGRPEEELASDHSTLFKQRPGEEWSSTARQAAKRWLPPAITDVLARRRSSS